MKTKFLLLILLIIFSSGNISILLDFPILRPILGLACYLLIPGIFLIYILKLNSIVCVEKFLLSVQFSISLLILLGLLGNYFLLWLGYIRPLSSYQFIIFLWFTISILGSIAYLRNKSEIFIDYKLSNTLTKLRYSFDIKRVLFFSIPIFFPLLCAIGRYFTDIFNDNSVLLFLFFLIIAYVLFLSCSSEYIPDVVYPLAIGMISITLLLSRGLISSYLIGGDIFSEYNSYRLLYENALWSPESAQSLTMASLSVSLLPVILQSLLHIEPLYIEKLILLIPLSLIPVVCYVIYKQYLGETYAFLASFFFIAQIPFLYLLSGQIRVGIALFTFVIMFMVILNKSYDGINKKIILLFLLFSLIVEYYVLPFIFLALISSLYLFSYLSKNDEKLVPNYSILFLGLIWIYLWWGLITTSGFINFAYFGKSVYDNLVNLFVEELFSPYVTSLYSIPKNRAFFENLPGIYLRITSVILFLGVLFSLTIGKLKEQFSSYRFLMLVSIAFVSLELFIPTLSFKYGVDRLYLQVLTILSPAFIVGCRMLFTFFVRLLPNHFSNKLFRLEILILTLIIIFQFVFSSYLFQQIAGKEGREILDTKSLSYDVYYVHVGEVNAAEWLNGNGESTREVLIGNLIQPFTNGVFEFTSGQIDNRMKIRGFSNNSSNDYVFLQHLNIFRGLVNSPDQFDNSISPLNKYSFLFDKKHKIYNNNLSIIYV